MTTTRGAWDTYNAAADGAGVTSLAERDRLDNAVADLVSAQRAAVLVHL